MITCVGVLLLLILVHSSGNDVFSPIEWSCYGAKCISHKCLCAYHGKTDYTTQPAITRSKLIIETLEQGVKYAQS